MDNSTLLKQLQVILDTKNAIKTKLSSDNNMDNVAFTNYPDKITEKVEQEVKTLEQKIVQIDTNYYFDDGDNLRKVVSDDGVHSPEDFFVGTITLTIPDMPFED